MSNKAINNARHSSNCICSLKAWATEDKCDCELGVLRRFYVANTKASAGDSQTPGVDEKWSRQFDLVEKLWAAFHIQERVMVNGEYLILAPKGRDAGFGYHHVITERAYLVDNLINFMAAHQDIEPHQITIYELREVNESIIPSRDILP